MPLASASRVPILVACVISLGGCCAPQGTPRVVVRSAAVLRLPGAPTPDGRGDVDSSSPAWWDGDTLYAISSLGHPFRNSVPGFASLGRQRERAEYDNETPGGRWIEAVEPAGDGRVYGWYHFEPHPVCGHERLTAPEIGAAVSTDNGLHWHDLGIVLAAPADSLRCDTANYYFCGGNGDFCVNRDRSGEYVYFYISTYHANPAEQGIAVARMRWADRDAPVGRVRKWHAGRWREPGLGGHVTPIMPVTTDWHRPDANAFWGPSIHWNTHLRQWVMLLNRARDKDWNQEGIYVLFNRDLADPGGWSAPRRILEGDMARVHWYPQVLGTDAGAYETDRLAGRVARLFVKGRSEWELEFRRPDEP